MSAPKCRICKTECPNCRGYWNKLCGECKPIWEQQFRVLIKNEDMRFTIPWNEVEKYRPPLGAPDSYKIGWCSNREIFRKKYKNEVDALVIIKKIKKYGKEQHQKCI